jgi:hypothetical protein
MSSSTSPWRAPLALAVLLFVLSSAAYWFEFRKKPENERREESARKVFDIASNQVVSIRLQSPGRKAVELRCLDLATQLCKAGVNSRWEMVEPLKLKADDSVVQSLLSSLNNLLPTDTINLRDEPAEQRPMFLRQYGLEASQRAAATTVTVAFENGGTRTLFLGEAHPMGQSRFGIATEGGQEPDTVLLLESGSGAAFEKPVNHWREKRFVPVVAANLKSVKLTAAGSRLEARRESTGWKILSGGSAVPGDIENVDSWISTLVFLAAEDFAADSKNSPEGRKSLEGSRPLLSFELESTEEKPFRFEVRQRVVRGSPATLLAVSDSLDPVYRLDDGAKSRLLKKPSDLQLKKLLGSLDRFNARTITLEAQSFGPQPLVLQADDSGAKWTRLDTRQDVPADKVSGLLEKLSGERIIAFPSGGQAAKLSPGKEALKIRLADSGKAVLREIELWKSGARLMARDLRSGETRLLELDSSIATGLPWDAAYFSATTTAPAQQK